MSQELKLGTELRGRAAIVRLGGALDIHGAERFDREVARLIRRPASEIIVDLRRVTFMDSLGLRSLLAGHENARRGGVPLWIIRGGRPVERVLRMTGTDVVLPLIDRLPRRLEARARPRLRNAPPRQDNASTPAPAPPAAP